MTTLLLYNDAAWMNFSDFLWLQKKNSLTKNIQCKEFSDATGMLLCNLMFSLENFSDVFLKNQGLSSEVVIYKHMKINCTGRCVICLQ